MHGEQINMLGASRLTTLARYIAPAAAVGYSVSLDGSTSSGLLSNSNYTLGTGDFTIECWAQITTDYASTGTYPFSMGTSFADTSNVRLMFDGAINRWALRLGGNWYYTTKTWNVDTWYHLAIVRSSGTVNFYVDGIKDTDIGTNGNITFSTSLAARPMMLGRLSYSTITPFPGYVDEFRISSTARYTANFEPAIAEFTDDANTLTLLHMDDYSGSTVYDDDSVRGSGGIDYTLQGDAAITAVSFLELPRSRIGIVVDGNTNISTTQSKFGGASAYFDGTDDRLYSTDSDLKINDYGSWTVEGWFYYTSGGDSFSHVINNNWYQTNKGFTVTINASNDLMFYWGTGSSESNVTIGSISVNTWHHFAVTYDGSTMRTFLDGTAGGTGSSFTLDTPDGDTALGANLSAVSGGNYIGYIDEIRVSKTARYTSGFTPSASAFTNDADTVMLLHMNGDNGSTTFIDDNSTY